MSHKVYFDRSAASTEASALIAEAWNAFVQAEPAYEGQGVCPVDAGCRVLYVVSEDDDVCGVLVFREKVDARTFEVVLAYVEPSMRRKRVMASLVEALHARAAQAGALSVATTLPIGSSLSADAIAKLFGEPLFQVHEHKLY